MLTPCFFLHVLKAQNHNQDSLKFEELRNLARENKDAKKKLELGEEALVLAKKLNYSKGIGQCYYLMSQAKRKLGDLDESLELAFDALSIFDSLDYQTGKSTALNTIGSIYITQENYELAIKYLKSALDMNANNRKLKNLGGDYNNLGEAYRLNGQLDSALIYFNNSLEIFKELDYQRGIAYAMGNIGLVQAEIGQHKIARANIDSASVILDNLDNVYPIVIYKLYIADIYFKNKKIDRALLFAHESLNTSQKEQLKIQVRDASLKLSELYEAKGDFQKAYSYQSQYIAYRDSINNEETIREMADLRTEYEVGQKQAELDLANTEKAAQRKLSIIIGAGLLIFLILIGVIAVIQYRNNLVKKANNQLLRAQKQELEQQKVQLESLNDTKDRFFSIISHDLRGPVNAFFGVSKLIKMYVAKGKVNDLSEIADDLETSVRKLSGLLDGLLEWAVQQQGQFPNIPEKVNFNEMANDLMEVFENMAMSKSITLKTELPENTTLFVDRNSTMTIFRNLINNALKFTEEGGSVTIRGEFQKESASLQVVDSGVGIPKDKLDKLFSLQARKSTWGTAGEKGLGLGLQLAFEFAEMNNGSIRVESEEGVGTTFFVELPLFETATVTK